MTVKSTLPCWVVFVDREGREVPDTTPLAIELRSAGPGWRWHDFDDNEWDSAGAPLHGESLPRWVMRERKPPHSSRVDIDGRLAALVRDLYEISEDILAGFGGSFQPAFDAGILNGALSAIESNMDPNCEPYKGELNSRPARRLHRVLFPAKPVDSIV